MLRRTHTNSGGALRRRRVVLPFSFLVLALVSSAWLTLPDGTGRAEHSSPQSGAVTTQTEIKAGLQRIIFTTERGSRIFVNLPADLRRGETCSGTVFGEGSGKSDAERAAGQDELRSYTVELAGQKIPATGGRIELRIPSFTMKDDISGVILRNQKGKVLARAEIKVSSQATVSATAFRLPSVQLGEIIEIDCPCDGVIAATDYVKVAGAQILILAESPRKTVVFNTRPQTGSTEIEVNEHGQVVKREIRILGIKLTAQKTGLLKGEQTTLHVEVSGLDGVKEPVPLRLENKTTSVLTMGTANVEHLTIKPAEVQAGGTYKTDRTLTGIQVGDFLIEGTVVWRDEVSPVNQDNRVAPGSVAGRVVDQRNTPVRGVAVSVAGWPAVLTNSEGEFEIRDLQTTERLAVSFSAPRFMNTTRIYEVGKSSGNGTTVVIWARAAPVPLDAALGGRVAFSRGGGVTIPPNSLVDINGRRVRGKVMVSLTQLDVSDQAQLRTMAGDFKARMPDKSIRMLESFGVFEIAVLDARGLRVDLTPGTKATFDLPVPKALRDRAPKRSRLFSFDTVSGFWIEEGEVFLTEQLVYSGTINRLDWDWNVDDPLDTTCITVKFIDVYGANSGPIAGALVEATGVNYTTVSSGYTNGQGLVCLLVKINSAITIKAYDPHYPGTVIQGIEATSPNIVSGASDCGDPTLCPLVATVEQDARLLKPRTNQVLTARSHYAK